MVLLPPPDSADDGDEAAGRDVRSRPCRTPRAVAPCRPPPAAPRRACGLTARDDGRNVREAASSARGLRRVTGSRAWSPMPGQQLRSRARRHVRQLAEQRVEQDAQHDDVGLQELAGVHRHVADTGGGRDGLGHDQGQPHDAQRVAQCRPGWTATRPGRITCRNNAQRPGRRCGHLDQAGVDAAHAVVGVDVDGKGRRARPGTAWPSRRCRTTGSPAGSAPGAGCCAASAGSSRAAARRRQRAVSSPSAKPRPPPIASPSSARRC